MVIARTIDSVDVRRIAAKRSALNRRLRLSNLRSPRRPDRKCVPPLPRDAPVRP